MLSDDHLGHQGSLPRIFCKHLLGARLCECKQQQWCRWRSWWRRWGDPSMSLSNLQRTKCKRLCVWVVLMDQTEATIGRPALWKDSRWKDPHPISGGAPLIQWKKNQELWEWCQTCPFPHWPAGSNNFGPSFYAGIDRCEAQHGGCDKDMTWFLILPPACNPVPTSQGFPVQLLCLLEAPCPHPLSLEPMCLRKFSLCLGFWRQWSQLRPATHMGQPGVSGSWGLRITP